MAFKTIVVATIIFGNASIPNATFEQQFIDVGKSYLTPALCREALQHAPGNLMASATNKLNKMADSFLQPPGYLLYFKRLTATCVLDSFPTDSRVRATFD